jgi:hypothetical protein
MNDSGDVEVVLEIPSGAKAPDSPGHFTAGLKFRPFKAAADWLRDA